MRARLFALLLVAFAAAPAIAQAPHASAVPHAKRGGGLWADVGAGVGYLHLTCLTCTGVVVARGTAVTFSVGFTPAHNVLLGLQAQQWSSAGSPSQRVRSLLAVVQWYPWPATGYFVRAGNGIVRGPVAPRAAGAQPAPAQGTGVGFAIGMGYDFKLSRRIGLTLQVATHISALGDLTVGGQPAADVIAYVTRFGVAVVFR